MNNFEKQEQIGREVFKNNIKAAFPGLTKYTESDDPYSTWDVRFEVDSKIYLVEIKTRAYKSTHFSTWMLEKVKLDNLRKLQEAYESKGLTTRILYANIFTDDSLLIWNLNSEFMNKLVSVNESHVKTTAINTGKKNKEIIHLPYNKAVKFNIVNNK